MNTTEIIIISLLLLVAGFLGIYYAYRNAKQQRALQESLQANDYASFKALLTDAQSKKSNEHYRTSLKLLDAAVSCGEKAEAYRLIAALNETHMSRKDYIVYNLYVLSYAVRQNDVRMGEVARDALNKRFIPEDCIKEAIEVVDIYLLHKSNHIDACLARAQSENMPSAKAGALLRVATQYRSLGDEEKAQHFLQASRDAWPDSRWNPRLDDLTGIN